MIGGIESVNRGRARSSQVLVATIAFGLVILFTSTILTAQQSLLEEVIVTAQKRAENIQDVPISITAFSGDELTALGVKTLRDVVKFTPGLTMNASSVAEGDTVFTIRGIGMNSVSSNQNPAVMVYLDEVPLPSHILLGSSIFDVQQIEVLKGPQGTLYGRNTTGGAIRVISNKPSQETDLRGRLEFTSFDGIEFDAAAGGALTETLSARFAVNVRQQAKGWQTLEVLDQALFGPGVDSNNGEVDRKAYRLSFLWEPTERFQALVVGDYATDDSEAIAFKHSGNLQKANPTQFCSFVFTGIRNEDECASFGQVRTAVGGTPVGPRLVLSDPNPDARTVLANFGLGNRIDSENGGFSAILTYEFDRSQLTSVTGYRDLSRSVPNDQGGAPFNTNEVLQFDDLESFTQEMRLASDETWGNFDWIVGVFYSNDDIANTTIADFRDHASFSGRFTTSYDQNTEGISAFSQINWRFAQDWNLTAGLRYTDEDKGFDFTGSLLGSGPVPIPRFNPDDINNSDFGGRLGVDYSLTENVLLYTNVNQGFKSGGFPAAIAFSIPQLQPFESEQLTAYELGFKSTLADGRILFNLVGYYYDWEDFQAATAVDRIDPISGQGVRVVVLTNAGDAELSGTEAEFSWLVTDEITLQAGTNYMFKREIVSGNFAGDTPAHTPELTFTGQVSYNSTSSIKGFHPFAQLDYSYQSEQEFILRNAIGAQGESYSLVNLNLGVLSEDGKWTVSAFARNLFDETYTSENFGVGSSFLPARTLFGPPRIYGISLSYAMR